MIKLKMPPWSKAKSDSWLPSLDIFGAPVPRLWPTPPKQTKDGKEIWIRPHYEWDGLGLSNMWWEKWDRDQLSRDEWEHCELWAHPYRYEEKWGLDDMIWEVQSLCLQGNKKWLDTIDYDTEGAPVLPWPPGNVAFFDRNRETIPACDIWGLSFYDTERIAQEVVIRRRVIQWFKDTFYNFEIQFI